MSRSAFVSPVAIVTAALLFVLLSSGPLAAQPAPAAPPTVIDSPVVHADGRVSVAFRAGQAKEVVLAVNGQPRLPMQRDPEGVWRVTTPALPPDVYGYVVVVDGVNQLDPLNTDIVPNLLNPQSKLHIAATPPQPWDVTAVPRGVLHRHFYRSDVVGDDRDYYVYTPPGYSQASTQRYPVLYLLHGFSDDARGWTSVGHAHVILDNLIARKTVTPMVLVMPLGYGDMAVVSRRGAALRDPALRQRSFDRFRESLLTELLPAVERDYRVSTDREQRAIAGLSMGGAESLFIGLNTLDRFGSIGAFSSGGFGNQPNLDQVFSDMSTSPQLRPNVLWVACGVGDGLLPGNRAIRDWLVAHDVPHQYTETPGAHTWFVWRRYLTDFLPLLFRP